ATEALLAALENLLPLSVSTVRVVKIGAEGDHHHGRTAGVAERVHDARGYRQPQQFAFSDLNVPDLALLLEPNEARPHHGGGFDGGLVEVIAAHLVRLREHHMHVLLSVQLIVRQRLEQSAARIAECLDRLKSSSARIGAGHASIIASWPHSPAGVTSNHQKYPRDQQDIQPIQGSPTAAAAAASAGIGAAAGA